MSSSSFVIKVRKIATLVIIIERYIIIPATSIIFFSSKVIILYGEMVIHAAKIKNISAAIVVFGVKSTIRIVRMINVAPKTINCKAFIVI